MEEYARVKAKMFQAQRPGDFGVVNADDVWTDAMKVPDGVTKLRFSVSKPVTDGLWTDGTAIFEGENVVAKTSDNPLPGRHNLENVLAALTMVRAADLPWDRVIQGLRAFRGVEHRIEFVTEKHGVRYYNDSKSTNIDSLRVALESFDVPVVLIAGGRGKGADYRVLRELVNQRVRAMVVLGEDAPLFENAFGDIVRCVRADDMGDAVRRASSLAEFGDVVLLSPACASFDMFQNFEHRGTVFKDCVRRYLSEGG